MEQNNWFDDKFSSEGEWGEAQIEDETLSWLPEYGPLMSSDVRELFKNLHASEWILANRVIKDGVLDFEATAEQLKIPLKHEAQFSAIKASISGLTDINEEPIEITIGQMTRPREVSLSFGHELGHYFLWMSQLSDYPNEEEFCEYFGRQMALYSADLSVIDSIDGSLINDLQELYNVEPKTVILQLIDAGKLPNRVVIDTMLGNISSHQEYNTNSKNIVRCVICSDCEINNPHDTNFDPYSYRGDILNLTEYGLGIQLYTGALCSPIRFHDDPDVKRINNMYKG